MLNPESAKEQLKTFRSPEFVRARVARLTDVPKTIRSEARVLFDLDEKKAQPPHIWLAMQERRQKLVEVYRSLGETNVRQLVDTVLPELAPYIRQALTNVERYPYTSGHTRKPFRSKTMPGLLDRARTDLLISVLQCVGDYPPDIEWIATWAPHAWLHLYKPIGQLLAAAIDVGDAKGQRVFDILLASAKRRA
jgi:hypothetical protein